jgi:ornithine cyclodeaminase/alanine dehydrogenase-like protein (mu-crystallin family)
VNIRCLSAEDVWALLPMRDCIELMASTLSALDRGELTQLQRVTVPPTPGATGVMALLAAHRREPSMAFGLKAVCVFSDNPSRGLDPHQGLALLFDGETGEPRCLADASAVTALRTAAVSGLATRALARPEASIVAVIGAGGQALPHLQAIAAVRPIHVANVWSRSLAHSQSLAAAADVPFAVEPAATVKDAVRDADIVVTLTPSERPVLEREWLADGVHVNAIGAVTPHQRELDVATIRAASLFVDGRDAVLRNGGDVKAAIDDGVVEPGHIHAELGEVVRGRRPGRTRSEELTVFKSVGLAAEDLAVIAELDDRAPAVGAGSLISL